MLGKKTIKHETVDNGKLNTMVVFYNAKPGGRLPSDKQELKKLFTAWAEVYNPSLKDIEIMRGKGIKRAVTIVIRNPLSSYRPKNNHIVEIKHVDYKDERWNVEDIRPKPDYITLLLKGEVNGDLGN